MANRDKRSRALLRNLRKQARKGTLSAREQDALLNQEKKFRKARRRRRRGIGAGLGAALGAGVGAYLASPAFASLLERGADAAALRRELRKQGASEEEAAKVEKAVESAPEGSSPEEIVQEVENQVAPSDAAEDLAMELEDRADILDRKGIGVAGDEELIRDIESIEEEEEAGIDDDLARSSAMNPSIFDDPRSLRVDADTEEMSGGRPELSIYDDPLAMGAARAVSPMRGMSVLSPAENQGSQRDLLTPGRLAPTLDRGQLLQLSEEERAALGPNRLTADEFEEEVRKMEANRAQRRDMRDNTELTQQLRREGGYDPRTGEYVGSDRQQRIDDAFDEDFRRSAFTDAERAAELENARLDGMDDSAALSAALNALPIPNEGDFEFGEMGGVGQRPALTGPNNPLSRRVDVQDPGLRLPIVDIQEEPEDLYDPQEAGDLARYRLDQMLGAGPLARRRARRIFNEQNEMARAEQNRRSGGSGIPVRQQMGGKNPKMADLMKKVKAKYGIR